MRLDMDYCGSCLRGITDQLASRAGGCTSDARGMIERVQDANHWARHSLESALAHAYPLVRWAHSEREEGASEHATEGFNWVYDPIDGAYHFLQGLPLWSSSLALVENGRTIAALVYDPAAGEMFTATAGAGAFSGERRLSASNRTALDGAVVSTTMPSFAFDGKEATDATIASITKIVPEVFSLRIMASSSLQLAYVAAGRLDAYWSLDGDVNDWLAGALLAREAGAYVANSVPSELAFGDTEVLAAAPALAGPISKLLWGIG